MSRSLIAGVLLLASLLGACAVAAPEPRFTEVARDGDFQIRDYPPLAVAEVTVEGSQWGAANRGFRLLAGYIFGANKSAQKIEMTAPVIQMPQSGEQPVLSERAEGDHWIVRFIMPAGLGKDTLPAPNDRRVRLLELPATRYAAVRFSGWALPFVVRSETRRLQAWMASRHLEPVGPAQLAQYDPPWTIWFLRRNDVLTQVAR